MGENKEIMEYNVIGIPLDIAQVKELLKQAVKDNLITQEEMDNISVYRNIRKEMKLKEAIEVLCNALREDTSEGSYYHSWQANIAMAFYDEFGRQYPETYAIDVHEISNEAAKNFLNLLISK